jgi:hypothetical protein
MLATSGNTESSRFVPEAIYVALVVDVIFDHTHPSYSQSDGYNVGSIKVRIFGTDNSIDTSQLNWANPIDMTSQQLPLVGELVVCHKILDTYFYTKAVPIARRLQENGMLNLNKELSEDAVKTIQDAVKTTPELTNSAHKYGQYFKPDSRVRPLKHFEGDVVLQGRMGHSIRFGSSQLDTTTKGMAPNLILRTGQAVSASSDYATRQSTFGLTIEDINNDASSIWMTSNQTIPFVPSTKQTNSYSRSYLMPLVYDGASVIINSSRVVLNSKKSNILLFSNEGIHLNSYDDVTIDTDNDIKLTAALGIECKVSTNVDFYADEDFNIRTNSDISLFSKETVSIISKKIYMGSVNDDGEPMVGGTTLAKFLARLILAFVDGPKPNPPQTLVPGVNANMHVITPTGPGQLAPAVIQALKSLYSELAAKNPGQKDQKNFSGAPFNSEANFISIQNDEVEIPKNSYTQGKQSTTETATWTLADDYYRIS